MPPPPPPVPPSILAVAPPGSVTFDWHHAGAPDLVDPAIVVVLLHDVPATLSDVDHSFVAATSCLRCSDVVGGLPTDPPIGKSISQWEFDFIHTADGESTDLLLDVPSVLRLSVTPLYGQRMSTAWARMSGLELTQQYLHLDDLVSALRIAKETCAGDNRVRLVQVTLFVDEARPVASAGAAVARNRMYGCSCDTGIPCGGTAT